ncbi:MAG: 6-phosphogluconolactonase [Edaphobacter sp.]|nr:6-phosphogluconolactonase [Edaphobacter sp.]
MKQRTLWSRREFVQSMGCSSLAAVGPRVQWLTNSNRPKPGFAYVGFSSEDQRDTGIQAFAIRGERWTSVQTVASQHPTALALHPSQRFLYTVNEIESYRGLPSGTVEAYGIDPDSGHLTLLNRQPLSLSGTLPRHLAVSPDGGNLVVAVHGGGAYNVLPIDAKGALGKVSGIVKEIGSGPNEEHQDAAHPQMVIFDTTGRHLLGTDMGSDRVNVFTLTGDGLSVHGRSATQPGSGPRHMAMHPTGHLLYVTNHLEASISCYGYDAANGKLQDRLQHSSLSMPLADGYGTRGAGSLLIHPSGHFLYTAHQSSTPSASASDGIAAWRIDSTTGALTPIQLWTQGLRDTHAMTMLSDGEGLLVLSQRGDGVVRLRVDPASGRLGEPRQVARVSTPISLAVKYV